MVMKIHQEARIPMVNLDARISFPAAVLADQTRESIVMALMDNRAYTAKELAHSAGITPQTASFHLKKLLESGILVRDIQGRHSYYRLHGPDVAAAIEALMRIAPTPGMPPHAKRYEEQFLFARHCYDHLAGWLGVAVAQQIETRELIRSSGLECHLTEKGTLFFAGLGINTDALKRRRRNFLSPCIDCTERRPHLSGALSAAMLEYFLDHAWLKMGEVPRALILTPLGSEMFEQTLGLTLKKAA